MYHCCIHSQSHRDYSTRYYSITHKKHKITAIKIQVMVIGLVSYDSELADDDKIVIISGNDFIFIDL